MLSLKEVIPIFKENLDSVCSPEVLSLIKQTIVSLVEAQEETSEVSDVLT